MSTTPIVASVSAGRPSIVSAASCVLATSRVGSTPRAGRVDEVQYLNKVTVDITAIIAFTSIESASASDIAILHAGWAARSVRLSHHSSVTGDGSQASWSRIPAHHPQFATWATKSKWAVDIQYENFV